MHSDEIERRLRMPAHDEPSFLPPLVLPQTSAFDLIGGRVRAGSAVRRYGCSRRGSCSRWSRSSRRLLPRRSRVRSASTSCRTRSVTQLSFAGDGVSIDYPDNWVQLTPEDPGGLSSAFTSLIVANRAVPGCSTAELNGARVGGNAVPFATQIRGS